MLSEVLLPMGAFAREVEFMAEDTMLSTDCSMDAGKGVLEPEMAVAVACAGQANLTCCNIRDKI